jgi:hypothetical protein
MVSITSFANPATMATSQPPSIYQSSIYNSYSYPYPTYNSRNASCENLLPAKEPLIPKTNLRYAGPRTTTVVGAAQSRQGTRLASNGIPIPNEQKKSYGIGGAGNIRMSPSVSHIFRPRKDTPMGWMNKASHGEGSDEYYRAALRSDLPTTHQRRRNKTTSKRMVQYNSHLAFVQSGWETNDAVQSF